MSKLLKSFLVVCLSFVFLPLDLNAASIFVETVPNAGPSNGFVVDVVINTGGDSINAVEGEIVFDDEVLEVLDISNGNSSLNFWVSKPRVEGGKISFSGVTPGGFFGERKKLLSISFRSFVSAKTEVSLQNVSVLKNDGLATKVEAELGSLHLDVEKSTGALLELKNDMDPPESFLPFVGSDQSLFEGKYFLVFATQDKGVGMGEYLVKEGFFGSYVSVESPYLLPNQNLDKKIYVRAVDMNGNDRVETLKPQNYKDWYKDPLILGIIVLLLVVLYIKNRWSRHSNSSQ